MDSWPAPKPTSGESFAWEVGRLGSQQKIALAMEERWVIKINVAQWPKINNRLCKISRLEMIEEKLGALHHAHALHYILIYHWKHWKNEWLEVCVVDPPEFFIDPPRPILIPSTYIDPPSTIQSKTTQWCKFSYCQINKFVPSEQSHAVAWDCIGI